MKNNAFVSGLIVAIATFVFQGGLQVIFGGTTSWWIIALSAILTGATSIIIINRRKQ